MSSTITPIIHNTIAESIIKDLVTKSSKYYYFLGKTLPYNTGVEVVPNPTNDYKFELETRREIIALKQIAAADVSYVIPRNDWVSGTVYSQYDDAVNMAGSNFYVLTNNFNVYKCLDNNYNAPSTVKPTGTDIDSFKTADGYVWKFMMNLPLSLRNKFLSTAYMPVTTAHKSSFYNNGGIDSITILDGGSGYIDGSTTILVESTTGIGADVSPIIESGSITGVIINNPGEGYTYATLTVIGSCTTPANLSAVTTQGSIETVQSNVELSAVSGNIECIKVTNSGSGYGYVTVTIDGDGTGSSGSGSATAEAIIENGRIVSINMIDKGKNYTFANVTITGNGTSATARAIMSPYGGHGKDAISELYADMVLFFSNISTEKNQTLTISNDYRQFGIIKNPTNFNSSLLLNTASASSCYLVNCNSINVLDFENDSNLIDSAGHRFKVIAAETNKVLLQSFDNAVLHNNSNLINTANSQELNILTVINPTFDKYSGKMLYVDNRAAFFQTLDQAITFQTVIKF